MPELLSKTALRGTAPVKRKRDELVNLQARVPREIMDRFRVIARQEGLSVAAVVRRAIARVYFDSLQSSATAPERIEKLEKSYEGLSSRLSDLERARAN